MYVSEEHIYIINYCLKIRFFLHQESMLTSTNVVFCSNGEKQQSLTLESLQTECLMCV